MISIESLKTSAHENCVFNTNNQHLTNDLANLLDLPHKLIRHKNSARAMCLIGKYLNKKQTMLNKISQIKPYKWNNKRSEWIKLI